LPVQQATETQSFSYTIPVSSIFDPESNDIVVGIETTDNLPLPGWLEYDSGSHTLSGTPGDSDSGLTLNLLVTAFDGVNEPVTSTPLQIDVIQINQSPTSVSLNNESVSETTAGAVVGLLSTTDPDATDSTHTYSVDDSRFEVVGEELKLKDNIELKFEETQQVVLNVTATDSSGSSVTNSFTVTVEDMPEPPQVAAALPETAPVEIQEPVTDETPEVVVSTAPVVVTEQPANQNSNDEQVEINSDIAKNEETNEIDLSSLIQPLEKVALVEIEQLDSTISTINRQIDTEQIGTLAKCTQRFRIRQSGSRV